MVICLSHFGRTSFCLLFVEPCWFFHSSLSSINLFGKTSCSWKDSLLPSDDFLGGDSFLLSDDIPKKLPPTCTSFVIAYNTFGKPLVVCGHVTLPKSLVVFGSNDEISTFDVLWILGPIQISSNVTSQLITTFLVLRL